MLTIHKHLILDGNQETVVSMPERAKVLSAQYQNGQLFLWEIHPKESEKRMKQRIFLSVGTGEPIAYPEAILNYIGTVQQGWVAGPELRSLYVWHIFEVLR